LTVFCVAPATLKLHDIFCVHLIILIVTAWYFLCSMKAFAITENIFSLKRSFVDSTRRGLF
jgi:hypothetical protein